MSLETLWQTVQQYLVTAGVRLVAAIVILIVGFCLTGKLHRFLDSEKRFTHMDPSAKTFIASFISATLRVVLVITVAAMLGVPMTSIIAVLGSCGLAVGLALQGSLSNLAGGLMIMIFHPFRVGDYISAVGLEGTVTDISILYTKLLTVDNRSVMIPNGSLSNSSIVTVTGEATRRVDLDFSVSYGSDIEKVEKVLSEVIAKHPLVLKDPAPFIRLKEHASSALVFVTRSWVKTEDYWTVYFDLLEQVKIGLDAAGIEIPFQQMDVHVINQK